MKQHGGERAGAFSDGVPASLWAEPEGTGEGPGRKEGVGHRGEKEGGDKWTRRPLLRQGGKIWVVVQRSAGLKRQSRKGA